MQSFDFSDMDDLYAEIILDHYRSPRNQKELEDVDIETEGINPFCGDEVYLKMKLEDGLVGSVSFRGVGCSISQASASMLTEVIKGKDLDEAEAIYFLFQGHDAGQRPVRRRSSTSLARWRPWPESRISPSASSAQCCPGRRLKRASGTTASAPPEVTAEATERAAF